MPGHNSVARRARERRSGFGARGLIVLLSASFLAALSPPGAEIAGYWKIEGKLAGHRINLICRFDRQEAALTGPCFGDGTPVKGSVSETGATWSWKTDGHVLTFEGRLQSPSRMMGVIKTPIFPGVDISGAFTAERPITDQSDANPPQGMDALRDVVRDFSHGRLKEDRFTEAPAGQLRKEIDALRATYEALGSINALTFVDRLPAAPPELSTEIYELEFARGRQVCSVDVTPEIKIADLICRPI